MKKRVFILIGTIGLFAGLGLAKTQVPIEAFAEGEQTSMTSESAPSATSSDVPPSEDPSYWKNLYENFVVPLLGGVSISSMLSAIVSISFVIVRAKGEKKHNLQENERYLKYAAIVEKAQAIISLCERSIESSNDVKNQVIEYMSSFTALAKELLDGIQDMLSHTEELEKMQPAFVRLCDILGKMAANTKELVSSGAAEDIRKIADEMKGLVVSNG